MAFGTRVTDSSSSFSGDSADGWFDRSPFSSSTMTTLQFKHGEPLKVHREFLQRNPRLMQLDPQNNAYYNSKFGCKRSVESRSINHVSRSAGHVLVHFLYTDTYRALKWTGPTNGQIETVAKLNTAIEVYAIAREFELEGLEELAREQITLLGKDVDVFTIVDIAKEAYPTAKNNDTWFPTFIKSAIKVAFEKPRTLTPVNVPTTVVSNSQSNEGISLAKILLQGALEVYWENSEALAAMVTAGPMLDGLPNPEQPVPDPESVPAEPDSEPLYKPAPQDSFWGSTVTKGKKGKKARTIVDPEPEPEPVSQPELVPEPEPVAEPAPETPKEDDPWDTLATSKSCKKGKKGKKDKSGEGIAEPERVPELEPELAVLEPELEPVLESGPIPEEDVWGDPPKKSKKVKGKRRKIAEPEPLIEPEAEPTPVEKPEVMAELAFPPIQKDWVGDESEPWPFLGAKRSPRPST